jgi:signal transduction histidine kinase
MERHARPPPLRRIFPPQPHGDRDRRFLKPPLDSLAVLTSYRGKPLSTGRLLVVDDSPTFRHALAAELEAEGYQVVLAASGEEALTILDGGQIDCILVDMIMPGLNGIDSCRHIKARRDLRTIPIVMMTAQEGTEAIVTALRAGADDFVVKSGEPDVLKARVNGHVRRRQFEEQNREMGEELQRSRAETAQARAAEQLADARAVLLGDLTIANQDLQSARDVAVEAVRVRDEFLTVASHELRTPLTSLLLQMHTLTKKARNAATASEPTIERLDVLNRQIEKLAGLVDALLDVSRISSGQLQLRPEACDLVAIAREVIKRYDEVARAGGCALTLDESGPVVGYWDSMRLEQVLTNLISNALKFGPGKPIDISVSRRGQTATLTVVDHGIGIAPEKINRIFNKYERAVTADSYGGLGLGLFISRNIAEAHAGRMRASSEPGHGTSLSLDLPVA